jgi:hypothetical protein
MATCGESNPIIPSQSALASLQTNFSFQFLLVMRGRKQVGPFSKYQASPFASKKEQAMLEGFRGSQS